MSSMGQVAVQGGRSKRSASVGRGTIDSSPLCQIFRLDDASR